MVLESSESALPLPRALGSAGAPVCFFTSEPWLFKLAPAVLITLSPRHIHAYRHTQLRVHGNTCRYRGKEAHGQLLDLMKCNGAVCFS